MQLEFPLLGESIHPENPAGKYDDDVVCAFCQLCLLFYKMFIKNVGVIEDGIETQEVYPRMTYESSGIKYRKSRFV